MLVHCRQSMIGSYKREIKYVREQINSGRAES